jgi:glutaredoxin 3
MAKVEIYTTNYCPYCTKAKNLLDLKGVKYEEIDVTGDDEARAKLVEKSNGGRTVPQIFIGGKHIGGCDDMYALNSAGKLDGMLNA